MAGFCLAHRARLIYSVTEPRALQWLLSAPVSAAALISVFRCAWKHSDKSSSPVLGPGTGTAPVPGGLSCGELRDHTSPFPCRSDVSAFLSGDPHHSLI